MSNAGEKIGRKEQSTFLAVVSRVAPGVTREMDGLQSMPEVEVVTVVDQAIRGEGSERQNSPAESRQQASDAG